MVEVNTTLEQPILATHLFHNFLLYQLCQQLHSPHICQHSLKEYVDLHTLVDVTNISTMTMEGSVNTSWTKMLDLEEVKMEVMITTCKVIRKSAKFMVTDMNTPVINNTVARMMTISL
jgi:hypothetical protein